MLTRAQHAAFVVLIFRWNGLLKGWVGRREQTREKRDCDSLLLQAQECSMHVGTHTRRKASDYRRNPIGLIDFTLLHELPLRQSPKSLAGVSDDTVILFGPFLHILLPPL